MEKRHLKFIWVIILDIVLAGGALWLAVQTVSLAKENGTAKTKISLVETTAGLYAGSKKELSALEEARALLAKYVIADDDQTRVLSDFEDLAKVAQIKYSLKNATLTDKLTLDLEAVGNYRDVYRFIRLIEEKGYWVSFEKLVFSRAAFGNSPWAASIILSVPLEK